jgi:hypothetical protein
LTGLPIEPVGIVGNKLVWPILGGAQDPNEDEDEEKDEQDDSDSGGADDDDSDAGSADDDGETVTKADLLALTKRMKAADQRAAEAEKKLKAKEDAEKDEITKASEALKEAQAELAEAQSTIKSMRLQNSFLTANKQKWHDSDTALDLAQSKGYLDDVADDEGNVDKAALSKALDRLAKDKPFLVDKQKKASTPDDDDGPSGSASGGRSDNAKDAAARKKQLKNRFASLNR